MDTFLSKASLPSVVEIGEVVNYESIRELMDQPQTEMVAIRRQNHPGAEIVLGANELDEDLFGFTIEGKSVGLLRALTERICSRWKISPNQIENLLHDLRRLIDIADALAPNQNISAVFAEGKLPIDECVFHHDMYRFAILCTYTGPGTEYVARADVDLDEYNRYWASRERICKALADPRTVEVQDELKSALRELDTTYSYLREGEVSIKSLRTGDIGIWKGDAAGGAALLHRMPRTTETRIRVMLFVQ